jgi:hypothetical protein
MKKVYIEPIEGKRVLCPETMDLLTSKKEVPLNKFWSRRIKFGDVLEVKNSETKSKKESTKPNTKEN